jgi:NLR family CARD domain-containing protein 3
MVTRKTQHNLAKLLKKNSTLVYLDVFNAFDNSSVVASTFSYALENNTTLTYLNLGWLGGENDANIDNSIDIYTIAKLLKKNSTLSEISLRYTPTNETGFRYLGDALKQNTTLKALNLCDNRNKINGTTIQPLFDALQQNNSLTILKLGYNKMDHNAITLLAHALQKNSALKKLDLEGCNIDNKKLGCIANVLSSHPSLTYINLSSNKITDEGFPNLFINAIQNNTTLTKLNLWNNRIGLIALRKDPRIILTNWE